MFSPMFHVEHFFFWDETLKSELRDVSIVESDRSRITRRLRRGASIFESNPLLFPDTELGKNSVQYFISGCFSSDP
jgi:hypothetical protein